MIYWHPLKLPTAHQATQTWGEYNSVTKAFAQLKCLYLIHLNIDANTINSIASFPPTTPIVQVDMLPWTSYLSCIIPSC